MKKVRYRSNKKQYMENSDLPKPEDCDTIIQIEVKSDVKLSMNHIEVWCPDCGNRHRFTAINQDREVEELDRDE